MRTIFYTEFLTEKVDLRSYFISEKGQKFSFRVSKTRDFPQKFNQCIARKIRFTFSYGHELQVIFKFESKHWLDLGRIMCSSVLLLTLLSKVNSEVFSLFFSVRVT